MTSELEFTKTRGFKRVYLAFVNSLRALKWLTKNEAAFRQELLLLIACTPLTFIFDITVSERLILLTSLVFIIFTEIVNTAIEAVVDRVGKEIHPLSGLAKDLGSAAVMISFIITALIWIIVLIQ